MQRHAVQTAERSGPGLYVHVPFCVRKCRYCAFFSREPDDNLVQAWLDGIRQELSGLPDGFQPQTVFLGGGTPSVLAAEALRRLLSLLHDGADLHRVTEWTCEVNPGTLSSEKADILQDGGVNRLSIGAQSMNDSVLRRLGRIHTAGEVRNCVRLARQAGFQQIGLDLIYGVPDVPFVSVQRDAEELMLLQPDHLSCYCLEVEEGTPLDEEIRAGSPGISAEDQRHQFDWIRRRLKEGGWVHYEISNFAKPGRECRHNGLYWSGGEYIGVGPAAHSHWNGVRWGNTATLPEWHKDFEETLSSEAKARETLVMGLRRLEGWSRAGFREATGRDYDELQGETIRRLAREGRLIIEPDRIRLPEESLFVSDSVFAELV